MRRISNLTIVSRIESITSMLVDNRIAESGGVLHCWHFTKSSTSHWWRTLQDTRGSLHFALSWKTSFQRELHFIWKIPRREGTEFDKNSALEVHVRSSVWNKNDFGLQFSRFLCINSSWTFLSRTAALWFRMRSPVHMACGMSPDFLFLSFSDNFVHVPSQSRQAKAHAHRQARKRRRRRRPSRLRIFGNTSGRYPTDRCAVVFLLRARRNLSGRRHVFWQEMIAGIACLGKHYSQSWCTWSCWS